MSARCCVRFTLISRRGRARSSPTSAAPANRGRSSASSATETEPIVFSGTVTRGRLALTTLLGALTIWLFVYKAAPKMPDFEVYWKAASRADQAEPLYRESDGHFVFKYLPAFAVLAIPLAALPRDRAEIIWFGGSVALLVSR